MKIGDRVRYVGPSRPDWHDIPATIISLTEEVQYAEVTFDRKWHDASGYESDGGNSIPINHLEHIMTIDTNRPIETIEDEPRACRIIGVLERIKGVKTVLLSVPYRGKDDCGEVEINLDGKPVSGTYIGGSLSFRNPPVRDSGFYPVDRTGYPLGARGITSLDGAKIEYTSPFFVEIIRIDGVPTEAKIHAR